MQAGAQALRWGTASLLPMRRGHCCHCSAELRAAFYSPSVLPPGNPVVVESHVVLQEIATFLARNTLSRSRSNTPPATSPQRSANSLVGAWAGGCL